MPTAPLPVSVVSRGVLMIDHLRLSPPPARARALTGRLTPRAGPAAAPPALPQHQRSLRLAQN